MVCTGFSAPDDNGRMEDLRVGNPKEWPRFADRNRLFLDRFERLEETINALFHRILEPPIESLDLFVFYTGRFAADDFFEILLLCGNAESHGAQKLLRSMFERVVTLMHLMEHSDELQAYLGFYWVTQRRLLNAIESTFKSGLVDAEQMQQVNEEYARVKEGFQRKACDSCGAMIDNYTWTKTDMVQMAKNVGLSDFIVPAYYLPLAYSHPTVKGFMNRLKETPEGAITVRSRLDPIMSDRVLCAAHGLLLYALQAQVLRFKLDRGLYERAGKDFEEIWDGRPDLKVPALPSTADERNAEQPPAEIG
jgi:hypothetical protein